MDGARRSRRGEPAETDDAAARQEGFVSVDEKNVFAGALDMVGTHDPLDQSAMMKKALPGEPYIKLIGEPDPNAGAASESCGP